MAELRIPVYRLVGETEKPVAEVILVADSDGAFPNSTDFDFDKADLVPWLLYENETYEYEVRPCEGEQHLYPVAGAMFKPSARSGRQNEGVISTGSFVGRVVEKLVDDIGNEVAYFTLDILSRKLDFISEYQYMLQDIAEQCDELLMLQDSPASQTFKVDDDSAAETLYERFSFVKAIVDSEDFQLAIQRICSSPLENLLAVAEDIPVNRHCRLDRGALVEFASSANRIDLDSDDPLRSLGLVSVPRHLSCERKQLSVDTAENRFVKFVLESFSAFLSELTSCAHASDNLRREADCLIAKIEEILSDSLFRGLGRLNRLPLSSPALQRREGYRQVLRAWILFDCAAKFVWSGGEDVYSAGKRDVATLYEYWVYFRLFDIVSRIFNIAKDESRRLIEQTDDGFGITLRRGRPIDLKGIYSSGRKLNVRFSYNRTFRHSTELIKSGSWSTEMRPDYTLSIWPGELTDAEAESREAIVHIHFDAKYRLEKLKEFLNPSKTTLTEDDERLVRALEKDEEARGIYKRGDLLKMHAYNDAIKRTYGSYVIYPGDEWKIDREYHEIIPGLGAFVMRPTSGKAEGSEAVQSFIEEVLKSMLNRMTQRERAAIHRHEIYRNKPLYDNNLNAQALPDYSSDAVPMIPAEVKVLVGYCRPDQYEWVKSKCEYNFRCGNVRGRIPLTEQWIGAKYLLIHSGADKSHQPLLFKITENREVISQDELVKEGYPSTPSADYYVLLHLEPAGILTDGGIVDVAGLRNYPGDSRSSRVQPFVTTLEDVLQAIG